MIAEIVEEDGEGFLVGGANRGHHVDEECANHGHDGYHFGGRVHGSCTTDDEWHAASLHSPDDALVTGTPHGGIVAGPRIDLVHRIDVHPVAGAQLPLLPAPSLAHPCVDFAALAAPGSVHPAVH